MSTIKKQGDANVAKGKLKEAEGKVTDDKLREAQGKAQKELGKVQKKVVRDLYLKGGALNLFDSDLQVFSLLVMPGWMIRVEKASAMSECPISTRPG